MGNDVQNKPRITELLKSYKGALVLLIFLALTANVLSLALPKVISHAINTFVKGDFVYQTTVMYFVLFGAGVFIFTVLQNIVQTYVSEKVARDVRTRLSVKISNESYLFVEKANPSKLLTYLTSDVDSIKLFVSQAITSLVSSVVIILGASIMLLSIDLKLGLAVLAIVPIIAATFFIIFSKVRPLFKKSREIIDWLNKVINESILGAGLIRVINSQKFEHDKFSNVNTQARETGLKILNLFAAMIPIVAFVANLGTLIILLLGGKFVITGALSVGDFTAFNSYVGILVFPIFIIGFTMNIFSQASASYERIAQVLNTPDVPSKGDVVKEITGVIDVHNVSVLYGEKKVLKDVSFHVGAGTRTAIIGPTAAGKSQMLYLLTGLTAPTSGMIMYDSVPVADYDSESLHQQIGFVFQDSVMFNLTIRENIAFSDNVTDASLEKAIETAELKEFINTLPLGLDTLVSERGTSLSGGQKQRIMLARALALNPKILLLDDFTARVDTQTEQRILSNIAKNYPHLTLVSVTQKISSIEQYDEIVLLMEGEVLAKGTHTALLETSPEYVQIYNSQRSTNQYELHT
jgi:ATP-binding cassette subfamily B protein